MLKKLILLLIILSFSIENIGGNYTLYTMRYPLSGGLRPVAAALSGLKARETRADKARSYYSQTFAHDDSVVLDYGSFPRQVFLSTTAWNPFIKALLAQQVGENNRGKSLLSIGVGSGALEESLIKDYGLDITGVDITEELLKRAQAKGVKTALANGEDLPFGDASFDIVLICESIGHMDLDTVLKGAARVLRLGGEIHVTTYSIYDELHDKIQYEIYTTSAIISALENAGFGEISEKADILNLQRFIYLKAVKLRQKSSSAGVVASRFLGLRRNAFQAYTHSALDSAA